MSSTPRAAESHDALNEVEVVHGSEVIKVWRSELERLEPIYDLDVHRPGDAGWLAEKRDQAGELT